jgi:UDP-glucose 4-epimerase
MRVLVYYLQGDASRQDIQLINQDNFQSISQGNYQSINQSDFFCSDHQPQVFETMRRSSSHSSHNSHHSPSPSLSPISSRTSINEDDLDSDFMDLNCSQDADTGDYILVIGGLGFIGSHTTLELLKEGYNVVIVDNMSNSHASAFTNIQRLANKYWGSKGQPCPHLKLHKADYRSHMMRTILGRYIIQDPTPSTIRLCHITGVIHFAAYKSVEESTKKPLQYYQNNLSGLIDLLALLDDFGIQNFVFSSSATVYGSTLSKSGKPVREENLVHHETLDSDNTTPLLPGVLGLTSPYGRTKYFGEAVLADLAHADPQNWRITALRYFNPVGCEPSGTLGEDPRQKPTNLFPVVTQVLKGERPALDVFGSDWETCDGTAVRDYIHVVDLARGHIAALAAAEGRPDGQAFRAYNLGTGRGSTVNQVVSSMEKAAERSIPVKQASRRAGDVGFCVASTERAERELGWRTERSLDECASDTWRCIRGGISVGA